MIKAIEEKGKDDLAAIVAESGEDVEVTHTWQKDVSTCHKFFNTHRTLVTGLPGLYLN